MKSISALPSSLLACSDSGSAKLCLALRSYVRPHLQPPLQGRPGVGKTTVIREMARILSEVHRRRVVIVDTSNEIGGDGDIAHPGIGRARRMQVRLSSRPLIGREALRSARSFPRRAARPEWLAQPGCLTLAALC
jgi:hypothetical protein